LSKWSHVHCAPELPLSLPSEQIPIPAIEALSRRLSGPLRRFFQKRIGRSAPQEVDDLVQEVFVRLSQMSNLESVNGIEAYLFRTATNLLHDRNRRLMAREAAAHEPYEENIHGGARSSACPERQLLGKEALERLIGALYGLPEKTRSVWVLYHFEDLPHAEIARRLGIAQSTVEKHMSRANARLLSHLGRYT
jgi:RNA polymerase sigma factor (sigma-70 family)